MQPTARPLLAMLMLLAGCSSPRAGDDAAPQPDEPPASESGLPTGRWRAWLAGPGGELPFELLLEFDAHAARGSSGSWALPWKAWIVNGTERIEVPTANVHRGVLTLDFGHYDSRIVARWDPSPVHSFGGRLVGEWTKQRGAGAATRMEFFAEPGDAPRFSGALAPTQGTSGGELSGTWLVDFESDDDPAVGRFEVGPDGLATGTFLTTLGDYRYLAGVWDGSRLRLSCFDGAHAFLFEARPTATGLAGDFWSSAAWHETWTAQRDESAALPDAFSLTRWTGEHALDELRFPDLDGVTRSLGDPAFAGKARIVQLFGSWCPNCHDEAPLLQQLVERYGPRGLSVVAVAFEHSGDFERDAQQLQRFREHFGITYPILVGGLSDKSSATDSFGALDLVRAYPTTVFATADGTVIAVHTGFSGPATGPDHERLRERFEALIEDLLAR